EIRELDGLVDGVARLELRNGRIADTDTIGLVTVGSMADALRGDVPGVTFGDHGRHDATGLINSAFVTDGFVIAVEDGAEIARPIELQSVHDGGQSHVRNAVTVGE